VASDSTFDVGAPFEPESRSVRIFRKGGIGFGRSIPPNPLVEISISGAGATMITE
jgi:hypothetical protein